MEERACENTRESGYHSVRRKTSGRNQTCKYFDNNYEYVRDFLVCIKNYWKYTQVVDRT
jgi:hypothetical protein